MNINQFMEDHPNVIHIKGTWDMHEKSSFIDACDACDDKQLVVSTNTTTCLAIFITPLNGGFLF